VENRHGLIVSSLVWEATGTAEGDAVLEQVPGTGRVTVGGDKGFDTAEFVHESPNMCVTHHVAQNLARRGGIAIDGRTTQHANYDISQKKRRRIEECFGWLKTIALLRKVRHRGTLKVDWIFTFACAANNLVRMRNLMAQRSSGIVRPGRSVSERRCKASSGAR
jgi:Transposase DDE domain